VNLGFAGDRHGEPAPDVGANVWFADEAHACSGPRATNSRKRPRRQAAIRPTSPTSGPSSRPST